MKQTLIDNWQYLTLLITILGGWLTLVAILKTDVSSLRGDLKASIGRVETSIDRVETTLKGDIDRVEASLKADIARVEGVTQHLVDLHINHGDRISKVEERTKKL